MSRLRRSLQGRILAHVALALLVLQPLAVVADTVPGGSTLAATEAPAGFDNLTNGFATQEEMEIAQEEFDEAEEIDEGLGPVYNAQGCRECHQNPLSGGNSQITELRVGRFNGVTFSDRPGGSLLHSRAIHPDIQERVAGEDNVTTFRNSIGLFGDGFVEAIANSTLQSIRSAQPSSVRGTIIFVPVLEAPGQTRIGRFGHKNQQASLVSFSADAYLNEMGITNPHQPVENTSNGRSVEDFDDVPDPEDQATPEAPNGVGVDAFATFMRSLKVPPRDTAAAATFDAQQGALIFDALGCDHCHTPVIVTAPPGTIINGGAMVVGNALGNKIIRPFSDFLLHDVGTGDGIVQNGGQATRNMIKTPALWGLRTRNRLMHDGETFTRNNAILRHGGQATSIRNTYNSLSLTQKNQLVAFLNTL
jgi:CxxC motif-containing protein (DUF1111 family)